MKKSHKSSGQRKTQPEVKQVPVLGSKARSKLSEQDFASPATRLPIIQPEMFSFHLFNSGTSAEERTNTTPVVTTISDQLRELSADQRTWYAEAIAEFTQIAIDIKDAATLRQHTFSFLKRKLNSPRACFRSILGDSLQFLHVSCDRQKQEGRQFGLEEENIIVNAAKTRVAIIDGDQTNNPRNHPAGRDGIRDTNSIITVPIDPALASDGAVLFTCCHLEQPDAFDVGHLLLVKTVLRTYCILREAISRRRNQGLFDAASTHISYLLAHCATLDGPQERELLDKLSNALASIVYTRIFWFSADACQSEDEMKTTLPHFMALGEGAINDTAGIRFHQFDLLTKAAASASPVTAEFYRASWRISSMLGETAEFENHHSEVPPENDIAQISVVPVQVSDQSELLGYLWIERDSQCDGVHKLSDLSNISDSLFSFSVENGTAPLGSILRSDTPISNALEKARSKDLPVTISGPNGVGKLHIAKWLHKQWWAGKPNAEFFMVLSDTTLESVRNWLGSEGTVVFYRPELLSEGIWSELNYILGFNRKQYFSPEEKKWKSLNARIVIVHRSTTLPSEKNSPSPASEPEFDSFLTTLTHTTLKLDWPSLSVMAKESPDLFRGICEAILMEELKADKFLPLSVDVLRILSSRQWNHNIHELRTTLFEAITTAETERSIALCPRHFTDGDKVPIQEAFVPKCLMLHLQGLSRAFVLRSLKEADLFKYGETTLASHMASVFYGRIEAAARVRGLNAEESKQAEEAFRPILSNKAHDDEGRRKIRRTALIRCLSILKVDASDDSNDETLVGLFDGLASRKQSERKP
jgi:hypothetical protein